MSFTSHMVASLKHNKRERVSAFEKIKKIKEGNNIQVKFDKKASALQLKNIRKRLSSENRKRKVKTILILAIAISIIVYVVGFVKF